MTCSPDFAEIMIAIATADISDYDLESTFPNDLGEALPVVELNDELNESLGRDFVDVFVSVKRAKLRDYMKMMTQWEVGYLGSAL